MQFTAYIRNKKKIAIFLFYHLITNTFYGVTGVHLDVLNRTESGTEQRYL